MSDKPLFEKMDEQERVYAPEQVPGAVDAPSEVDQGGTAGSGTAVNAGDPSYTGTTAAGPVASIGTGLTGGMSTPNVGDEDPRTPRGDPNPQASYPLDHEHRTQSGDPLDTQHT